MADFRAIRSVSEAVVLLLQESYRPEDFSTELEFRVFTSRDFATPPANGASLFVYRIYPHGSWRTPAGRIGPTGHRDSTQLPVELHFLITVWGGEASLQHSLAGWVMRTLEDTPLLPAGFLNAAVPGVFRDDESVEIALAELSNEDMLRIWEVLGLRVYQLCIPYVARVLNIESTRRELLLHGPPVQERVVRSGALDSSGEGS